MKKNPPEIQNFLTRYVGIALALAFCLFTSVFSQDSKEPVKVTLKTGTSSLSQVEKLQLSLTVKNISDKPVYSVTGEKPRPAYDPNKNELGLGLDIQPANFHYFEFLKLKRLESNAKANITKDIPLSSWTNIGPGQLQFAEQIKWKKE
jgi:hypothetical protein